MSNTPATRPRITVVICTRNRATQLAVMLASLCELTVPAGLVWEICIVDNGSSDNTAEVVDRFADRLPVRCVREEEPGLSNARNRGVESAHGEYICWTDDDVELDREWLAAYSAMFDEHPEADIFGGRIIPMLQGNTPAWFAKLQHRWPLTVLMAKRDFGPDPVPLDLDAGVTPWGANYAVRTSSQRRFRYDPQLGVSSNQKRLGEEAEVIFQMMRAGASGFWTPGALVHHLIPEKRQTLSYVFEYFSAAGETVAYLDATYGDSHHMSRTKDRSLSNLPSGQLAARRDFSKLMHILLRGVGLNLRGLYHLRKQAFLHGILTYRRTMLRIAA